MSNPEGLERLACDTSVAVAALDATHVDHAWCADLVRLRRPALAGQATIETFSVMTRLPVPSRLSPATAHRMIAHNFADPCPFPPEDPVALARRFAEVGIGGGAVYDGLIASAATSDQRLLLTRDRRAERTYRLLEISYELLSGRT